jgi:formate C-acetyltransferase
MIRAIGTEKYDQSYGLGYKKGHGDLSPYPRVNRLRKRFLERPFNIDIERAVLVTEAYMENEDKSPVMKCALAFEKVLKEVTLHIYDDELIIGDVAAPAKAAPVYPEYSVEWIEDELLHHPFEEREHDRFYISRGDKEKLLKLLEYWRGRTVQDRVEELFDDEIKKHNEMGERFFLTNLYHYGGIGHFCPDYGMLLERGFDGLIAQAKEGLAKSGDSEFYRALIIELEAAVSYIGRYEKLCRKEAGDCIDEARKNELLSLADNCGQIAGGRAKTFWQALLLWHFATTLIQIESNGHSVSYGRMDQWLYPYYESDIKDGRITKDEAQELLECAYIRMGNPSKLKDRMTVRVRNGRGWGGESLTIGGVDQEGRDATNDLTFMMLEASAHTRLMNPWVCVRLHENTPHELKVKAFECIRAGFGHPKLFNDRSAVRAMERKGMSPAQARDYAVVGCVEIDLPGKEYGMHDAAYINLPRILNLTLDTCLEKCNNIEDVMERFKEKLGYVTSLVVKSVNIIDRVHGELKPTPFASAMFENCIRTGRDLTEGGAEYNFSGPQACGIATCADSVSAISQLVFDEKVADQSEYLKAVHDNWKGHDYLYALVNSQRVHHFGNDDSYADRFYREIFEAYCGLVSGRENPRGGVFCPGVYSVNANVGMGITTPATADGRCDFEPISDNMGPVHTAASSHDFCGPTALANSVNCVDHSLATNGTLLNLKFTPECVAGESGRENLISFVDAFFKGGAMHCQFNIMSSEMMRRAMEKPEEYRDMLVRVAGYSAYFVELSRPLQMDLISRTELSF